MKGGETRMKKAIAIVVAMMFIFALSAATFAAEAPKAAPAEKKAEEKKAPAKTTQITGEVGAVDAKAKTITVKGKKGDVVIGVDDKMLADVKAGDKVEVKYAEADGKNTAKSVKKVAAKAEKKEAPKAEEKKAAPAAPAAAPAAPAAAPAKKKPAGGY
jgi:microtubule-associated protein 1